MIVKLAGYNIDSHVIEEAKAKGISKDALTPEVLSAAYARISRNPAPVTELRKTALGEVEKARKSNKNIIFGMGHHSVAEHAVFNFDIVGISRLAIEELEHFRLCSFTEKSQRYITLDNDFVMPAELEGTPHEAALLDLIKQQGAIYNELHEKLFAQLKEKHPDMMAKKSNRNTVDGWAKEDARYATLLCTSGQLGFTANARNLELIVKRLNASKLEESNDLAKLFYDEAFAVAPSIILFTKPSDFDANSSARMRQMATELLKMTDMMPSGEQPDVVLTDYTPNGDVKLAAALLSSATAWSLEKCHAAAEQMSREQIQDIIKKSMENMEFYDTPPREFEHITATFELSLSAAAYGQMKRHRIMTQTAADYDPGLGITVPPAITDAGLEPKFREHCTAAEKLYEQILTDLPHVAPYALTNAHRRRVLVTANMRDLYHFCRLREDAHAQWDIRIIAAKMREQVTAALPGASMLLCGKDRYVEFYQSCYGVGPKIDPTNI